MKIKGKKAISLIVLVITILVLSILAATVIISISNTNIISEASKTTFKSDMSSYKEAYEMYVANELAKNAEFDRTTLNITQKDTEFSDIFGDVESRYKEGLKIVAGKLVYESSDEAESEVLEAIGMKLEYIDKDTSYVGYYADIDGDGTVDGVIFADLCIGGGVEYSYTIPKIEDKSTVKDYYISQANFSGSFDSHPVLTVTGSGADRFYVMSLSNEGSYYWYYNAANYSYSKDGVMYYGIPEADYGLDPICSSSFGSGRINTGNMTWLWGGAGVSSPGVYGDGRDDVWGFFQNRFDSGFVPSYYEWKAFADNVGGLYGKYWTSEAHGIMRMCL